MRPAEQQAWQADVVRLGDTDDWGGNLPREVIINKCTHGFRIPRERETEERVVIVIEPLSPPALDGTQ